MKDKIYDWNHEVEPSNPIPDTSNSNYYNYIQYSRYTEEQLNSYSWNSTRGIDYVKVSKYTPLSDNELKNNYKLKLDKLLRFRKLSPEVIEHNLWKIKSKSQLLNLIHHQTLTSHLFERLLYYVGSDNILRYTLIAETCRIQNMDRIISPTNMNIFNWSILSQRRNIPKEIIDKYINSWFPSIIFNNSVNRDMMKLIFKDEFKYDRGDDILHHLILCLDCNIDNAYDIISESENFEKFIKSFCTNGFSDRGYTKKDYSGDTYNYVSLKQMNKRLDYLRDKLKDNKIYKREYIKTVLL